MRPEHCRGLCLVLGDTGQGAPGHRSGLESRCAVADREPGGAVWAEGPEGGCAQRLESAGPLREAGPRLGWADGRASSHLLSDIQYDQTRGARRDAAGRGSP